MVVEAMVRRGSGRDFETCSADISFGLFAEEMVLVTGRVFRGEELRERDRMALERARALFNYFNSLRTPDFRHHLAYTKSQSVPVEVIGRFEEEGELFDPVPVLDAILEGRGVDDQMRPAVKNLQKIFVDVGKMMLVRTNAYFR